MATQCTEATENKWEMTDLDKVRRLLYLGCETGTYYMDLKKQNREVSGTESLKSLLASDKGVEFVKDLSTLGLDNPLVTVTRQRKEFAFEAYVQCARHENVILRQTCYSHFDKVIRTSQDLLDFAAAVDKRPIAGTEKGTGWGRSFRRAVGKWFNTKEPVELARITTRRRRIRKKTWDHRDVLRLAHVKPKSKGTAAVLKYLVKGLDKVKEAYPEDGLQDEIKPVRKFLIDVEDVHKLKDDADKQKVMALVEEHRLHLDHVNNHWRKSKELWTVVVQHLPLKEILPDLGRLTNKQELFGPQDITSSRLCERLKDEEELKAARLHPYDILQALKSYRAKRAKVGTEKIKWTLNKQIVEALDAALLTSFKFLESTGKRFVLAIDVSPSMKLSGVNGSPGVTAKEAVAIMSMQVVRTEKSFRIMAFSKNFEDIQITPEMNFEQTKAKIGELSMGSMDVAHPMDWALKNKVPADVFIVFTDVKTTHESLSPSQALKEYRKGMQIDAKLVVVALASNQFTVADPTDSGMLDIAGFNASGPELIRKFSIGEL